MYVMRDLTELSYPAIAREFGGRDHTTVIHAVDKITKLMKERQQRLRPGHGARAPDESEAVSRSTAEPWTTLWTTGSDPWTPHRRPHGIDRSPSPLCDPVDNERDPAHPA